MRWARSIRLGLLLSQAGEFGFVLFAQAASAQLILPEAASLVRRGRHPVDGHDAVPDALHRLARAARRAERRGSRRARILARNQCDRRRLWPVRPDRRADADGQADRRDADRQEAEPDRAQPRNSGPRSIMATALRIDLLRTAGAETAKVIAFCNDSRAADRAKLGSGARGFSPGRGHGPGLRPART